MLVAGMSPRPTTPAPPDPRHRSEAYQPGSSTTPASVVLLVPGDIELRTGGYGYDREIVAGLRALGWHVAIQALDDSYPFPCDDARRDAARTLAAVPDGVLVLADGLAFGAMPDEAALEASRLRFVALVHHPLALETGLDAGVARALFESERRALATARGVVVTSPATVDALAPYGVPRERIHIVVPGVTPAPPARGTARHRSARPRCSRRAVVRGDADPAQGSRRAVRGAGGAGGPALAPDVRGNAHLNRPRPRRWSASSTRAASRDG